MPLTVTLPDNYGWVILAASSTTLLTGNVGKARAAAGIKYPQLYAEKAEALNSKAAMVFNCCQRAHANTMESLPAVLFTTAVAGLRYPILSASLCATWIVACLLYTIAYSSGNPENRNRFGGILRLITSMGLGIASITTSIQMILKI